MKRHFYLFRRGSVYYSQDALTGKQQSLNTRNRDDAQRLVNAKSEATASPLLNLALAKAYLPTNQAL